MITLIERSLKRKWKRSDITQRMVLEAYACRKKDDCVDEMLVKATGAPHKVVWTAMEREMSRGYVDCGVSLRVGWLTDAGHKRLACLRFANALTNEMD